MKCVVLKEEVEVKVALEAYGLYDFESSSIEVASIVDVFVDVLIELIEVVVDVMNEDEEVKEVFV